VAAPAGAPGTPGLLLALLLPMLVGRARRRAWGALAALTALAAPATASAQQDLTSFQVEHFEPLPGQTRNVLNVATSESARHLEVDLGLLAHYVNDPLQFSNPDGSEAERAISDQVKAELSVNLGLFDLAELGVVLPVVLFQDGDDLRSFGRPGETIAGGGIADIRLIPKFTILRNADAAGFGVALAAPMYIPLGDTNTFNSDGGFRVEPRLIADWRSEWGLTIAANVAYQLLRSDRDVYNFVADDVLRWGVATRVPTPVERLAITGSVFGNASFQEARQIAGVDAGDLDTSRPVELLAGAEYGINETLVASLGGGAGLTRGVGAPDFRVVAGIGYAPAEEPEEPALPSRPEPEPEVTPAPGDRDGDGILDPDDGCPDEPEDIDAFEDADGCPDLDDDEDGIPDTDDDCRLDPEDPDGWKDEDGCPDPDNDGDGIKDINDSCPLAPELVNNIRDEDGCPEEDTDKDGIVDPVDKCPTEPETYNGKDDEDGCPDGKQTVVVTKSEIKILKRVYFATNKDVIKKRSYPILDAVAAVLRTNPQVELVRIGGHTDDMGKDDYNLDLSQRRADAVRDYLVAAGIDPSRLTTQGFGETEPLCKDIPENKLGKRSRKYKECRAQNRRVEFKILKFQGDDTVRDTE
jgi:outer membrane protein OmpA-like peptidoglycan-associated protein